ncbi:MAG: acyltransferase [Mycobacteriaceae bacterium]|nr:acyltransferase [Mycobacteriaceae bacterium]
MRRGIARSAGGPRWVAPVSRAGQSANDRSRRRRGVPALDGLRAIAVALVLAEHGGIAGMSGGFIGVDIFFVLSGFLITSLLFDELRCNGRIDLPAFWIRRARRLLPALVVMVLTVGLVHQLLPGEVVAGLRNDAVATFLWAANWRFIAEKTDYFTQGAPPSPLQHTWSLGVEEQYYFLWPLLLIAVALGLAARARRRNVWGTVGAVRLAVFILAALGALASAAAAIVLAGQGPTDRVYFGTDTRAQALLTGAAASALLVGDWSSLNRGWCLIRSRWSRWVARWLPIIGIAGLALVTHYATGESREFRAGLLIVVAVAAVVVVAPVALEQRGWIARILAVRPLVWLGTISYGTYLWHWPIFLVLNGDRTGWSGVRLFAARCALTLVVATVSWWVIERPVQRWRPILVPLLPLAGATLASAAAVTLLIVPVSTGVLSISPNVSAVAAVSPSPPLGGQEMQALAKRDPHRPFTVSVFGDSIGWTLMHYLPSTPGFQFVDHTIIGCSLVRGTPYRYLGQTLEQKPECDAWPTRWSAEITQDQPDVALLIIGRWETVDRVNEGRWTHIGEPSFNAYLSAELQRALNIFSDKEIRLMVATVPYSRRGEKPDGRLFPEDEPDRVDQWNAMLRNVTKRNSNVQILDLQRKLCPDGVYTAKVDGIQVRSDGVHLTPEGVKWLTPWLEESVR